MSDRCDSLKALAELETRLEKDYMKQGYLTYVQMVAILDKMKHEIQLKGAESPNDIKEDLGLYHNK